MTANSNNIEITRRTFLEVVFATTTAAAISGAIPLWPADAIARPIAEPFKIFIDESNYLIDPYFCYGDIPLPTHREQLSLGGLNPSALKEALNNQIWEIEHLISNPEKWSLDEVELWLDTEVELESLGLWQGAKFTPHGVGLDIYNGLSREEADTLGLVLVEGDHPGSDFLGVAYYGDVDELNQELQKLGMNLIVTTS